MKHKTTCDDCMKFERLIAEMAYGIPGAMDRAKKLISDRYGHSWPKRLTKWKPPIREKHS